MHELEKFGYPTLQELEAEVRGRGLKIEFDGDLTVLSKPVHIGLHRAPNSLVIHPLEGRDADLNGKPGRLTFRRYERYARGGAGLIWFEGTAAGPSLRSGASQLLLIKENQGEFERLLNHTRSAAEKEFGSSHKQYVLFNYRTRDGAGREPGQSQAFCSETPIGTILRGTTRY